MDKDRENLIAKELGQREYLGLRDLPDCFSEQAIFLADERLKQVRIVVVPDALWVKGHQPSESDAAHKTISFRQSYFDDKKNKDGVAWMIHELGHCQKYFDLEADGERYMQASGAKEYPEMPGETTYPNNQVERHAFGRQFEFLLRRRGWSRGQIVGELKKYYHDPEDFEFFNKVLDKVEGKS